MDVSWMCQGCGAWAPGAAPWKAKPPPTSDSRTMGSLGADSVSGASTCQHGRVRTTPQSTRRANSREALGTVYVAILPLHTGHSRGEEPGLAADLTGPMRGCGARAVCIGRRVKSTRQSWPEVASEPGGRR